MIEPRRIANEVVRAPRLVQPEESVERAEDVQEDVSFDDADPTEWERGENMKKVAEVSIVFEDFLFVTDENTVSEEWSEQNNEVVDQLDKIENKKYGVGGNRDVIIK